MIPQQIINQLMNYLQTRDKTSQYVYKRTLHNNELKAIIKELEEVV